MQLPNYKEAKLRNKNQVEREEYTFDSKLANLGKGLCKNLWLSDE